MMPAFIDMTGRVFGRWTVLSCVKRGGRTALRWRCRCSCGTEALVQGNHLRNGHSQSCGCFSVDMAIATHTTHGSAKKGARTKTYKAWTAMRYRCTDPEHPSWENYGGRGITVCERWLDFANFLADMGEKPGRKSLERVDNDGGYSPSNCIWADQSAQMRNTRATRYVTICGIRRAMRSVCEEYGISINTVAVRRQRSRIPLTEAFFAVLDRHIEKHGYPKSPIALSKF